MRLLAVEDDEKIASFFFDGLKQGRRIQPPDDEDTLVESVYRILYCGKMKTTLDIDDELLIKAKAVSARERKSLTLLIEEGLRLRLRHPKTTQQTSTAVLAIYRGKGGLVSGVDPLSNRALLSAVDE